MPKIDIGTDAQNEARKQIGIRRPHRFVRLLFKIDDAIICTACAIAKSFIDGFASYGMAYAAYVPENQTESSARRSSKATDRSFEQTMSELRALAHVPSLPGTLPPRGERTDR